MAPAAARIDTAAGGVIDSEPLIRRFPGTIMKPPAAPPTSPLTMLRRYLAAQRGRVLLLSLLVLTGIALQLITPQLVSRFLDGAQAGQPLDALLRTAALFTTLALLRQAIVLWASYVGENVAWIATNELRADLADYCLRLDMGFHKRYKPGELIERVDGDVNQLAQFFSRLLLELVANGLLLVGVLVLLWSIDWRIGVAVGLIAATAVAILLGINRRVVANWERLRGVEAKLFGYLEEWLSGLEAIQTSGAGAYILQRHAQLQRERWHTNAHAVKFQILPVDSMPQFVLTFAYIVGFIWGTANYGPGAGATAGTVYLIFYYIDVLRGPLWEVVHNVQELQRATAGLQRIWRLFQEQPLIDDGTETLGAGPLAVTFAGVDFHYDDDPATPVLQDVNCHLAPGRVLGLLGRTGSGKSTLSKLLFRFFDVTAGQITLTAPGAPALDLRALRQESLRGRIGMVTQDVELFQASVRDNLTLFDEALPDERLLAVLAEVGLAQWLAGLPAGLDTHLEGSGSLSAGEAQLLSFARVFLADPGLVILDEASSRLDPATEQLLERATDRLLANRSAIIIAHRLQTVQRADDILILDGGRVAEFGPRAALAGRPGSRFARLLRSGTSPDAGELEDEGP